MYRIFINAYIIISVIFLCASILSMCVWEKGWPRTGGMALWLKCFIRTENRVSISMHHKVDKYVG